MSHRIGTLVVVGRGGSWTKPDHSPSLLRQKKPKKLSRQKQIASLFSLPVIRPPLPANSSLSSISTHAHTSTYSHPHSSREKKKKLFPYPEPICKVDKEEYKKSLSNQKKALLRLLFKLDTMNGKSVEDPRNFTDAPGVIACVRDTGGYLKVWSKRDIPKHKNV